MMLNEPHIENAEQEEPLITIGLAKVNIIQMLNGHHMVAILSYLTLEELLIFRLSFKRGYLLVRLKYLYEQAKLEVEINNLQNAIEYHMVKG
jgi:hypothetical protein